jgi:hypothetical protein
MEDPPGNSPPVTAVSPPFLARAGSRAGRSLYSLPMATTSDYYDILGLARGATDDEVKRAFRKLAQQWHPDVNTSPGADERFKEINEAYQVLSDPQRRQAYDMFGRAGVGGTGAEGQGSFGGFSGFGDIFDAFFGGAAAPGTRRGRPPAGADLRYDLRLTFDEAIRGVEKEITFASLVACETCGGSGAEAGSSPVMCPQCGGTGELRQIRSTMLGQMVNVTTCGRCRGQGRIIEKPCPTCRGDGRTERRRSLRVTIPPGMVRARPAPEVAYRATCTWWPTSTRIRCYAARTPSCSMTLRFPSARQRSGRACWCPRPRATSWWRSRRAPSRAPRFACVDGVCRTSDEQERVATCTSRSMSACPPA